MKKKPKAREIREAKKQELREKHSSESKSANNKPIPEIKPVEPVKETSAATINHHKKTKNKAAGLKSTLVYGDKLYMTSFGKGNTAIVEQKIDTSDYSFSDMNNSPSLKVNKASEKEVSFSSQRKFVEDKEKLSAVNPLYGGKEKPQKNTGQDMLGLKDKLEKRYFDTTFNDNIHIQIIHNILDIEKILAVYATNITAALDHIVDGDNKKYINSDFIGYMNTLNTYEVFMDPSKHPKLSPKDRDNIDSSREKFENLLNTRRLGYFGFDYDPTIRNKDEEQKKRLYHLIAFAGQLRQWSFHSLGDYPRAWLYKLDDKKLDDEYRDTLDYYFDKRFEEINANFVTQNATNLCILKEIYPNDDFRSVADLYHDFIVVKTYKNIGFSIKKLREKMLEREEAAPIKAEDMDSVRSKLYKLMDFCIFKYYNEHTEKAIENVDVLRACVVEEQKERFYTDEAELLWEHFGKQFIDFCNKINVWVSDEHEKEVLKYIDKNAYKRNSNVSYFSKLLYVMCFFLDGKEINDLLTTLINKFDNIASFINTAKELGSSVSFVKDYDFFNSSNKYVSELNIVKNISRMKMPSDLPKREMQRDALTILGLPSEMKDEAFNAELDKMLKKEIDPVTGEKKDGKNPFRNFISNNVIKNRRFIYVIKFCNPKNVRKLVDNTKVTEFVLKRMPEPQIDRYYKSCIDSEMNPTTDKKITALAERIQKMDFSEFCNVKQKVKEGSRESAEKKQFKAIIGLYLTVVYLLIKNLVNVNARYVMAFHCLERDTQLYGEYIGKDYLNLTDILCKEGDKSRSAYLARNKRLRNCVKLNIDNARKLGVNSWYRNIVAHLTAVRNSDEFIDRITKIDSYFALYQYLVQKQLEKKVPSDNKRFSEVNRYFADLNHWNTYVKDMVKALNAPFGYNIPRFKNLSIDALFDRNEAKEIPDDEKCPCTVIRNGNLDK